jgi:hypothetical protein
MWKVSHKTIHWQKVMTTVFLTQWVRWSKKKQPRFIINRYLVISNQLLDSKIKVFFHFFRVVSLWDRQRCQFHSKFKENNIYFLLLCIKFTCCTNLWILYIISTNLRKIVLQFFSLSVALAWKGNHFFFRKGYNF